MKIEQFWHSWVQGWAISRQIPPAKKVANGYLFDEINDGRREQELLLFSAENLAEISHQLSNKDYLCVSGVEEGFAVPKGWVHSLFSYMMICENLQAQAVSFSEKFTIRQEKSPNRLAIFVQDLNGEIVCSGQVGYYGEFVIYDRIQTAEKYRRQGFATAIMNLLTQDALERGIHKGLLCASGQGKLLYETLGWNVIGQYSRMLRENYTRV